ncbi:ATP-dependent zinc protease family protein [Rhodanobacter sp. BL-MT-08]
MTDLIQSGPIVLGWRERLALPELGIGLLKAKLDTGARSSSLHVDTLQTFQRHGAMWLRFSLSIRRRHPFEVSCEAPALDRRAVTDTGGRRTERWFIRTQVILAGQSFGVDVNLTDRRHMLFPLLLGRSALMGRFAVDPALSYTQSRSASIATDLS